MLGSVYCAVRADSLYKADTFILYKRLKLRVQPTPTYDCLTNDSPPPHLLPFIPTRFSNGDSTCTALEISPTDVSELLDSQALKNLRMKVVRKLTNSWSPYKQTLTDSPPTQSLIFIEYWWL